MAQAEGQKIVTQPALTAKPNLKDVGRRWVLFGYRALAAVGLLAIMVTFFPVGGWWVRLLAGPHTDARGDVLIVLGGGQYEGGVMSDDSAIRAVYAVRAYRDGGFKHILISGGPEEQITVADSIAEYLVAHGVPREVILLERTSNSTRENALNCVPILRRHPGTYVLMTSDYHMLRARKAFAKVGIPVLPRPVPDVEKRSGTFRGRWPAFEEVVLEHVKIAYYGFEGWL
jgi:uncharacterized SAM-binding protein YcdF (DUF218 family)